MYLRIHLYTFRIFLKSKLSLLMHTYFTLLLLSLLVTNYKLRTPHYQSSLRCTLHNTALHCTVHTAVHSKHRNILTHSDLGSFAHNTLSALNYWSSLHRSTLQTHSHDIHTFILSYSQCFPALLCAENINLLPCITL